MKSTCHILTLLTDLHSANPDEKEKKQRQIIETLAGQAHLRSKKELIEKFIQENLPHIEDSVDIPDHFDSYWDNEKKAAFRILCKDEGVAPEKLDGIIKNYLFSGKQPLTDDIIKSLKKKPTILQRKSIGERVLARMIDFVDTFINGVPTRPKMYDIDSREVSVAAEPK